MSQISPPIRILLVGSIVFMAAWFVFLRPGGDDEAAPAPAPAAQSPSGPAEAVNSATEAANATSAASAAHAGEAAAATAAGVAAAEAGAATVPGAAAVQADLDDVALPAELTQSLDKKVVVLMFGNFKAADDKRVRNSMKKVYRHQGKVVTHVAPISKVADYAPITRGANVNQSPTVLVVDRHRQVDALVGYVDSVSINQTVVDALLQDGALVDKDKFLQKLEGFCGDYSDQVDKLKDPRNLKEARLYLSKVESAGSRFMSRIRAAKVPSKWVGLRKQIDSLVDEIDVFAKILEADLKTGKPSKSLLRQARRIERSNDRLDLRLAGYGMEDCR